MITTHEREKLLNSIIFFEDNVENLGKIKLFKLLYFLDFEHFKQTGRSITGLEYYAWPKGPVPNELNDELENPRPDMAEHVSIKKKPINTNWMLSVTPLKEFDSTHFSRRELRILTELASEFRGTRAEDMIEATHLENMPWHEIYEKQGRKQGLIPYEYALRRDEAEEMKSVIAERKAVIDHFRK